jgi:hypothetical protein
MKGRNRSVFLLIILVLGIFIYSISIGRNIKGLVDLPSGIFWITLAIVITLVRIFVRCFIIYGLYLLYKREKRGYNITCVAGLLTLLPLFMYKIYPPPHQKWQFVLFWTGVLLYLLVDRKYFFKTKKIDKQNVSKNQPKN